MFSESRQTYSIGFFQWVEDNERPFPWSTTCGSFESGKPSLEDKLNALMEYLGLEFEKIPEKLKVKLSSEMEDKSTE